MPTQQYIYLCHHCPIAGFRTSDRDLGRGCGRWHSLGQNLRKLAEIRAIARNARAASTWLCLVKECHAKGWQIKECQDQQRMPGKQGNE
jgi:hypothetical protein